MGCVGVERIHIPQERVKCLNPVKIFGLETLIPCRQRGLAQFGSHDWQPEDIQYWSTLGPSHLSSLLGLGMILFTGVHRSTHLVLINHTKGHPWPTTEAPPPPDPQFPIMGSILMKDQGSGGWSSTEIKKRSKRWSLSLMLKLNHHSHPNLNGLTLIRKFRLETIRMVLDGQETVQHFILFLLGFQPTCTHPLCVSSPELVSD